MGIKKSIMFSQENCEFILKAANITLIREASKEFYAEWHDLIYILKGSL